MEKYLIDTTSCALTKKKKTYYRTFDGNKSTIDLTIASLMIATELEWRKGYELGKRSLPQNYRRGKGSLYETTEVEHRKIKLDAVSDREHNNNKSTQPKHNRRST